MNKFCWFYRAKSERLAVIAFILWCSLNVSISKGDAFSVSVENGTFEAGSIDTHISVKIVPKPDVVQKVNWYRCSSPNTCSKFYVIDNEKEQAEQKGELGNRTTHVVMDNGPEYIMYLVILQPREGDQGEYRCQVQVAEEEHVLQGNMRLTKLEALRNAAGENITVGTDAPFMSLVIRMSPPNVTLYWIKCFHSVTPEPAAHFYTYDKNTNKISAVGDFGTRTSHTFDIKKRELLFSLIIQRPSLNDAGPYCCQVDAVGTMEPRLLVMWIDLVVTSSSSSNSIPTLRKDKWQPQTSHYRTVFVLLSCSVTLLLLCFLLYCAWKQEAICRTLSTPEETFRLNMDKAQAKACFFLKQ